MQKDLDGKSASRQIETIIEMVADGDVSPETAVGYINTILRTHEYKINSKRFDIILALIAGVTIVSVTYIALILSKQ